MATVRQQKIKRTILHMKIDPALKQNLVRMAKVQNRTLSNLIETILRAHSEVKQ